MERDLRRMLLSEHAPESTKRSAGLDTAVWTYARFRSFAERVSMGREDEIEDDKSATDDSRIGEFRVDFTTAAPPPSWEGPAPAGARGRRGAARGASTARRVRGEGGVPRVDDADRASERRGGGRRRANDDERRREERFSWTFASRAVSMNTSHVENGTVRLNPSRPSP